MSYYLRNFDSLRDGSLSAPYFLATGAFVGNVVAEGVQAEEITALETATIQTAGIQTAGIETLTATSATIGTLNVGSSTGAIFGNVKGNLEGYEANVDHLIVGGVPITTAGGTLVANTQGTHFGNLVGFEANVQQVRLGPTTTITAQNGNIHTANVQVERLVANVAYSNIVANTIQTTTIAATDAQISGSLGVAGSLTVGSMTGSAGSITVPLVVGNLQGNVEGVSANVTIVRASAGVEVDGVRVTRVAEGIAAPTFTGNLSASTVQTGTIQADSGAIQTLATGTLTATELTASKINLPSSGSGSVLSGRVGMRADVVTGLVVDGNAFVVGSLHGDGTGISGFEHKTNPSLEARLAAFASSERRLYVSTKGHDGNLGTSRDQAFRTVKKAASRAVSGTVIWVEAGVYVEDNPIYVGNNVAIIGDSLRNTILTAANPQIDFFHAANMTYFSQLRFVDLRSPGFCVAFPCSLAQVEVTSEGRIQPPNVPVNPTPSQQRRVPVIYSPQAPTGYYLEQQPPTTNAASAATVADIIEALFDGIAGVVQESPGEPFPQAATANAGGHTRAAALLRGNLAFFKAEMMVWITQNPVGNPIANTLTPEQKALCERDVGYLVEAVALDLTTGRAVNSLAAAVAYYNGAASILPPEQREPTADAIRFLGARAKAAGIETMVDPPLQQVVPQELFGFSGTEGDVPSASSMAEAYLRVQALLNGFVAIIRGDVLAEFDPPAMSLENGAGCARIVRVIVETRRLLQDDVMAFVDRTISLSEDHKARCRRDVGFILDALEFDLRNGSSLRTREYALKYFDGSGASILAASNQIESTAQAIEELRDRIIARADAETAPKNVFDKNATTRYESLLAYKNFNGTQDAADVTIQLDLPGPVMYVAYRLKQTNLKKWRLEARQTPSAAWEVLDTRDDEVPSVVAASTTETEIAVSRATGLIEGLANRILSLTGAFPAAAIQNSGGHTRAAAAVTANIDFLKAEIMAWVSSEVPTLSETAQASCQRDVGYIATAIAGDLRAGGITRTLEAAGLYYSGTRSILTQGTEQPTADAILRIGQLLESIIRNAPVPASLRLQTQVTQVFDDTGGDETTQTYPTAALTGYATYRLVLLQTQDSTTFKLGSIEFLDVQLPDAVSDGPALPNTVVADFEIVDPGAGYSSAPAITILRADGSEPDERALATATISAEGGAITGVTLQPRTFTTIQRLTITNPGRGYVTAPTVSITPGPGASGSGAQARAWIDRRGRVVRLELVEPGSGYDDVPLVSFTGDVAPGGVAATATASIAGTVAEEWSLARGRGYGGAARVEVAAPTALGGRQAIIQAIMGDDYAELAVPLYDSLTTRNVDALGRLVSVRLLHQGSGYIDDYGYADPPVISITPPEGLRPVIVGSPYVQNCTNLSGPWDTSGEKVPVTWPLPWNPANIYNVDNGPGYDPTKPSQPGKGRRILDNSGAGGGIRIDGRCCHPFSPLRSFVVDAFTQVNQGGIGFLLTNLAYAQFVSTFGTFCNIHALSISGSFANFSNSVTDFGRRGLVARGYYREPYLVGQVQALPSEWTDTQFDEFKYVPGVGYSSPVAELQFKSTELRGKGYTDDPEVTIAPPWGNGTPNPDQQQAEATVTALADSTLTDLFLVPAFRGRGYRFPPEVTIAPPPNWTENTSALVRAEATATLTGVSKVRVTITGGTPLRFANNRKPDALSIVRVHGRFYTVSGASAVAGMPNTYDVAFGGSEGAPPYIDVAHEVEFFQTSYISTGGHVFEYVGDDARGCTYNSLPEYGGVPDSTFEIVRTAPAKVFFTSSDHLGNQKIGDFFSVNQATGSVKLDAKNFDLSRISTLGPFIREGVAQGVTMREVSASTSLVSSTGQPDGSTVPTQTAVKGYVDPRAVPLTNGVPGAYLRCTGINPLTYDWKQFTVEDLPTQSREQLGVIRAAVRCDVISGLVADGDARIFGNLVADRVLVTEAITIDADLEVPGNLTAASVRSITGNVTAAGNLVTAGNVVASSAVVTDTLAPSSGTLSTIGNLSATANVESTGLRVTGEATVTGNLTSEAVVTNALKPTGGTLSTLGNLSATANVESTGLRVTGEAMVTGNLTSEAVVTNALKPTGGTTTVTGNLSATANLNAVGLRVTGEAMVTGNLTSEAVVTNALKPTGGTTTVTGNLSATANLNAVGLLVSGDATAANLLVSGDATAANLLAITAVSAPTVTTASIAGSGGTLVATGNVSATGNVIAAGTVTSLGMLVANAGLELTCAPSPHEPPQNRSLTFDLVDDTTLNINARGADGTVRTFTLSLDVPSNPPQWATGSILPPAQDAPYAYQFVATSPDNLTITYTAIDALPPGLFFDEALGILSGTITDTLENTLFTFQIAATDSNGAQTIKAFQLQYTTTAVAKPSATLSDGATAQSNVQFGMSVSIAEYGERVAVGEQKYAVGALASVGRVMVYSVSGGTWVLEATISPPTGDNVATRNFGAAVSLNANGEYLAIGGPGAGSLTGKVYVYKRDAGAQWILQGSGMTSTAGKRWGSTVRIDGGGTHVVFGASDTYIVPAFYLVNTGWRQAYTISGGSYGVRSVSMTKAAGLVWDGTRAVYNTTDARYAVVSLSGAVANPQGYLRIYRGSTTQTPTNETPTAFTDGSISSGYGTSLAIARETGDRVAVGAPLANAGAGEVRVYKRTSTTWSEERIITLTGFGFTPTEPERFGTSVSLSADGTRLFVGAPGLSTSTTGGGKVYIFTWDASIGWNVADGSPIAPSGIAVGDQFGLAVSATGLGDLLAASAPNAEIPATANVNVGEVFVGYRADTAPFTWTLPAATA